VGCLPVSSVFRMELMAARVLAAGCWLSVCLVAACHGTPSQGVCVCGQPFTVCVQGGEMHGYMGVLHEGALEILVVCVVWVCGVSCFLQLCSSGVRFEVWCCLVNSSYSWKNQEGSSHTGIDGAETYAIA
jgi:hypothetical protein